MGRLVADRRTGGSSAFVPADVQTAGDHRTAGVGEPSFHRSKGQLYIVSRRPASLVVRSHNKKFWALSTTL